MGRSSFFDNACAVMGLTSPSKEKLRKINVALGVNTDDGVHMYMVVGEVVSEALKSHRMLTTTFLTDFDRIAKESESRMHDALATSAKQNAEANARLVAVAIETKMHQSAKEQRREVSFWSAAVLLTTLIFVSCASWALGDFGGSKSSGFWRDLETRGAAPVLQNLLEWNPEFLSSFANCKPGSSNYGTTGDRGYCQISFYVGPSAVGRMSDTERFFEWLTPHIRQVWPWSGMAFSLALGLLVQPFCRAWRARLAKHRLHW